jgi:hypothetical protein
VIGILIREVLGKRSRANLIWGIDGTVNAGVNASRMDTWIERRCKHVHIKSPYLLNIRVIIHSCLLMAMTSRWYMSYLPCQAYGLSILCLGLRSSQRLNPDIRRSLLPCIYILLSTSPYPVGSTLIESFSVKKKKNLIFRCGTSPPVTHECQNTTQELKTLIFLHLMLSKCLHNSFIHL